jgi:thioredoxin reductase (NADPH)
LSSQVVLIHRRDRFRAQKALAERALGNPNIEVRFNTLMKEIQGDQRVASVVLEKTGAGGGAAGAAGSAEVYGEAADAVFIFAGTIPQSSAILDPSGGLSGLKADESGYIITDQKMASSVPGFFVAGDVRATPFRQVVVAAGEGAVAAHSAAEYIDNLKGAAYLSPVQAV